MEGMLGVDPRPWLDRHRLAKAPSRDGVGQHPPGKSHAGTTGDPDLPAVHGTGPVRLLKATLAVEQNPRLV